MGRMPKCSEIFLSSCRFFFFFGWWGAVTRNSQEKREIIVSLCIKLAQNKNEIVLTGNRKKFLKVKRRATSLEPAAVPALT